MAKEAAINPTITSWPGNNAAPRTSRLAEDSKTWKKGEIGYLTSGTVTPISGATGGVTAPYFRFCEDQATATSTSSVWVQEIMDGTEAIFFMTTDGTDVVCDAANVGLSYGLYTASNITYLDENVTSGAEWLVVDLMANRNTIQNADRLYSTAPGVVIARYVA